MQVLERDQYRCRYCGATLTNTTANMDHVYPYKLGGETKLLNLVACCENRNKSKGNQRDVALISTSQRSRKDRLHQERYQKRQINRMKEEERSWARRNSPAMVIQAS